MSSPTTDRKGDAPKDCMAVYPQHLMIVRVKVNPDVENDWNRWYDEKHLTEILECPGFESAARYVSDANGEREYITVYSLNDDQAMAGEMFNATRGWEQFASDVTAEVLQFKMLTQKASK